MSIDRVATASQTAYFLSADRECQQRAGHDPAADRQRRNATTYAGFGNQTQVLTGDPVGQCAQQRLYHRHHSRRHPGLDLQDTQLTSLSSLASQLQQASPTRSPTTIPPTLMTQAQSIFEQASAILNSQDANGNYIFGGGNANTPPVTVTSLFASGGAVPSVSTPFTNGNSQDSVQVADGQTVTYGITASDVGTGLMQELQISRPFRCQRPTAT